MLENERKKQNTRNSNMQGGFESLNTLIGKDSQPSIEPENVNSSDEVVSMVSLPPIRSFNADD